MFVFERDRLEISCHKKKPENLRDFLTSAMEKETFSAFKNSDLIAAMFISDILGATIIFGNGLLRGRV